MGLKLTKICQSDFVGTKKTRKELIRSDIAIFANGTGPRQTYFKDYCDESNSTIIDCNSSEISSLASDIAQSLNKLNSCAHPVLFVDVSCLSRPVLAEIFAAIKSFAEKHPLVVKLGYSLAPYKKSSAYWADENRCIRPVHRNFSGWSTFGAHAPLDIIVGLGYEKGKALGAVEYLEPRNQWIFVPHSPEIKYLIEVREHNNNLILENSDHVIDYQVLNPVDTFYSLRSLVFGLRQSTRQILLPFGPKIFFAVSLLLALVTDELAIWHVTGETLEHTARRPKHAVVMEFEVMPLD